MIVFLNALFTSSYDAFLLESFKGEISQSQSMRLSFESSIKSRKMFEHM